MLNFNALKNVREIFQSECGKMQTRITPNMDTFYAVLYNNFLDIAKYRDHHLYRSDYNYSVLVILWKLLERTLQCCFD